MARKAKSTITISAPRARPSGANLFARVSSDTKHKPLKKKKKKIYTKDVLTQDPSNFMDWGFGRTGLTGES